MSVRVFKWIDKYLGGMLCWLLGSSALSILQRSSRSVSDNSSLSFSSPRSIVIVRLWALGESILTLPLIKQLHEKYPKAKITVLCRERNKDVFLGQSFIQEVRTDFPFVRLLFHKFDLAIDTEPWMNCSALLAWWFSRRSIGFAHGVRSRLFTDKVQFNDEQHEVLTMLDLSRPLFSSIFPTIPTDLLPLVVSRTDLVFAKKILNSKKSIALCVGVAESAPSRMWPLSRYAKLADALAKKYVAQIVFVGGRSDQERVKRVMEDMHLPALNLCGKTSVSQLAAVLKICMIVVSNDTGPMHVAAAMGTRTIGLFCPNTPVRFAPFGEKNGFVYKPVLQSPCINVHKGSIPDCQSHEHMKNIAVNDVLKEVARVMKW